MRAIVSRTVSALAGGLWPARCVACGVTLDPAPPPVCASVELCLACHASLWPITPGCPRCGAPLPSGSAEAPGVRDCGACVRAPPPYDRARSAFIYGEAIQQVVLRLKRRGLYARVEGLWALAESYHAGWDPERWPVDLVTPVPLHPRRLRARGYNQAALLARSLAPRVGAPLGLDLLRRAKATRYQSEVSRARRADNVRHAFVADPRAAQGRRVLLIDDVYTTGATAAAASRALRDAGAAKVGVYTLARVVPHL